ncbi:hypothetical protein SDC9_189603 [bioreactor metagenome]|uniref:Uncharacterized protein n=1 Tax=bioreactor metagenome TaxID=1076179 RepID=A0A645HSX0_9ZZZZ
MRLWKDDQNAPHQLREDMDADKKLLFRAHRLQPIKDHPETRAFVFACS